MNINENNYKEFLNENKGRGILNIRAYSASSAIPIEGLKITISTVINNEKIIFFQGITNSSGIINNIVLPAPNTNSDDEVIPDACKYDIEANYQGETQYFKVKIYNGIQVIQNINIVPRLRNDGDLIGN